MRRDVPPNKHFSARKLPQRWRLALSNRRCSNGLINCRIAIIGHRDLQAGDVPSIQLSLADWCSLHITGDIKGPPEVFTSLAAGAEQVATWVFTTLNAPNTAKLRLVIPYAETSFIEDVRAEERQYQPHGSAWSFDVLASAASRQTAVRLSPTWGHRSLEGGAGSHGGNPTEMRASCYRLARRFLAENADVIIAVWDGVHTGRIGDTSDGVLYALSEECQEKRIKAGRGPLEVHWLAIPHQSNPYPATEAFTWQRLSVPALKIAPTAKTFRRYVRKLQVALPALLAAASVCVSFAGYYSNLGRAPVGAPAITDAALTAVSQLTLNGFDLAAAGPGALLIRIGRLLAVGFALTTIASVMNGLFRWVDDLALSWARSRPHDLVCGLGWRGRAFVADTAEARIATVAVEQRPDESAKDACARMGVPLVVGDAADPETIRKVGVSAVRCAFVSCGKDETSMQVVHQLAKTAPRTPMVCCVGLRSKQRFQVLQNALPEDHQIDLRIFNTESVTARMFLQSHSIDHFIASPSAAGAHVILLGGSAMAAALAYQVLQQGVFEHGKGLMITWITPDASIACQLFAARYPVFQPITPEVAGEPWIAEPEEIWGNECVLPKIKFFDLPRSDRVLLELLEDENRVPFKSWVTSVIVAIDDPAVSASIAYAVAPHLESSRLRDNYDSTIACYYNTPEDIYRGDIEHALNRDFPSLPVRVFSDFMGDCSKQVVRGDVVDRVARRVNGIHKLRDLDVADFDERCDKLWRNLSENDKESNRQAAAHAWVKGRVRARLRRESGTSGAAVDEALAQIEHRRWCAEYLLEGFRPLTRIPSPDVPFHLTQEEERNVTQWFESEQAKDAWKRARRHADLLPFDSFDKVFGPARANAEREKDLGHIRALDLLLGLRRSEGICP
jgi:TrkA-N domain